MSDIERWFTDRPVTTIFVLVLLTLAAVAIVYLFGRMLVKSLNDSAQFEQPLTTLMLILGTISIVALVGALFTKNESAFTIAATGVGAFAGALSSGAQKAIEHWEKGSAAGPPAIEEEIEDDAPQPVLVDDLEVAAAEDDILDVLEPGDNEDDDDKVEDSDGVGTDSR